MSSADDWTRVGVLLPSGNPTLERELPGAAGPGVSFHFERMRLAAGSDRQALEAMAADSGRGAGLLAHIRPDALLYGCTSGSMIGGRPMEDRIEAAVRSALDVPVVFTARSVADALVALGVRRVAVATPYQPWVTQGAADYLTALGLEVTGTASLSITDGVEVAQIAPEGVRALAEEADSAQADAVFLSCTALTTFDVVEDLEQRLGKPVVSSNSAALWYLLRALGRPVPGRGPGTLFR